MRSPTWNLWHAREVMRRSGPPSATALQATCLSLLLAAACSDKGACPPGDQDCPCVAGLCLTGFTCRDDVCVPVPGEGSGEPTGADQASTTDAPSTGGDPTDDASGCAEPSPILPRSPDPACLPEVPCVDDSNCPSGHVCNTVSSPPQCALLYCGVAGTPCHADSICEPGLRCHDGLCNPCTFCGDRCSVDFSRDPVHCGCCDNPIPSEGACIDGVPSCVGNDVLCEGVCVDLSTDPSNCGECGRSVPSGTGMECVNGEIRCPIVDDPWFQESVCDGTCVRLNFDSQNCGACGATCLGGTSCSSGYCYRQVSGTADSCDSICGGLGMDCAYSHAYCGNWNSALACHQEAPGSICSPVGSRNIMVCRCNPIPA